MPTPRPNFVHDETLVKETGRNTAPSSGWRLDLRDSPEDGERLINEPDWPIVEHEFVTSDYDYREIAARWGTSYKTMVRKASELGWPQKRADFRRELGEQLQQRLTTAKLQAAARTLSLTDAMVDSYMDDLANKRVRVRGQDALKAMELGLVVTGVAIEKKSEVLKKLTEMGDADFELAEDAALQRLAAAPQEAAWDTESGRVGVHGVAEGEGAEGPVDDQLDDRSGIPLARPPDQVSDSSREG